jgi:leader peptidase (prepilin peptidase)/N-methyltransferase
LLATTFALLFGLLIGSFLNVCIYRMPRGLSVVHPRSHCTACEHQIAWYDNVPLLSYLRLQGRCRHCGAPISRRYPLVELLTGVLFSCYILVYGPTPQAAKFCLFGALLMVLFFTDLDELVLPLELTLGGTAAGLLLACLVPVNDVMAHLLFWVVGLPQNVRWESLAEALLGAALPAFFLWLAGIVYFRVRHREGLGLGDVYLMLLIGSFLGLRGALMTLILGSTAGSVLGYAYIRLTKRDPATYELPYGSFLAFAGIAVSLAGGRIMGWYGDLY